MSIGDILTIGGFVMLAFHFVFLIFCLCKQKKILWIWHYILEVANFGLIFVGIKRLEVLSAKGAFEGLDALGYALLLVFAIIAFGIMLGVSLLAGLISWIVQRARKTH